MSFESDGEVEGLRARIRALEALCETMGADDGAPPLQVLLNTLPDSITVLDRDLRLRYLNRTLSDRTLDQVLGKSALEFMPEESHERFRRAHERAWQSGEVQHVEVASTQGEYVWETRLVPLQRDGEVYAVMGIGVDVTQRRMIEAALQEARKLEAVGRITADLAHNFNNLLLVMLTNLDLCKARAGDELRPRLLEVEGAAQRAADLVRRLMRLARKKRNSPILTHARLEEITARTIEMCKTAFDPRIEIALSVAPDLAQVHVDTVEVEQALLNVLLNARDALRLQELAAPRIEVTLDMAELPRADTGPRRPAVRVRVHDNGAGMDESVRGRVFEPFFTTKQDSGTGLGLATTYATMIDHEGLILCDSAKGAGTTFTLLFPAS